MTTNMQTPFQSTKKRRVIQRQSGNETSSKRSRVGRLENKVFTDLVKKTWLTYRCSPLYRFKCDNKSLKNYSRLLSAVFVANKHKKAGVGLDDSPRSAVFSMMKGLAVKADEPHAIELSIYTKEKKLISQVYLCSVEADSVIDNVCEHARVEFPGMKESIYDQFTVFPLILCRGNVGPRNIFLDWLQAEFDCSVARLNFSSLSLAWMLSMWSTLTIDDDKESNPTKIVWSFPLPHAGINHIETAFEAESLAVLWNGSRLSSSEEIEVVEVEKFLLGIEEHLTQHFKIKFQALPMQQLWLEIVHLHSEGKIKMFSKKHVHTVLSHLTCLAVERMQWKKENLNDLES